MIFITLFSFFNISFASTNYHLLSEVFKSYEMNLSQLNRFDHWIEEEQKTELIQFADPEIFEDNSMICNTLTLRVHTILKIENDKAYVHFYSGKMSSDEKPECQMEEKGEEYVLYLPIKPFTFDQRLKTPEYLEKRFPNLTFKMKENTLEMNVSDMILAQDFSFKGEIIFNLDAPIYANPAKMEGFDNKGLKYLKTKNYEGTLTKPDLSSIISLDQMPLCKQVENDFECSDPANLNYLLD